jgi:hypothetical protein
MGITSSTAVQANTVEPESRSVGYAENSALPLGSYTTFRGPTVDATSVLIAYTRTGDANLDGLVNDDDVTIVGASYVPATQQPHWALGDFEYNGRVDDDDVTLLGAFYQPAASPPAQLITGDAVRHAVLSAPSEGSQAPLDDDVVDLLARQLAAQGSTHELSVGQTVRHRLRSSLPRVTLA